jgi:hypothetical protein
MSFLSKIGGGIKKALDTNLALWSAPKTFFTKGVNAAIAETETKSRVQNVVSSVKSGAVAGLAVVAGGSTLGKAAISRVVQAVAPKTAKGVVAYAVGTPIAVGVLKNSEKARGAVVNSPSSLTNFGANIANIIDNPSIDAVKTTFKENPYITGAVIAGTVGAATLALAPVIASTRQTEAIQEQTAAIQAPEPLQVQLTAPPQPSLSSAPVVEASPNEAAPAGAETKAPKKKKKSTKKKKKKTRRSKKTPKKRAKAKAKKKKKSIKRKKK